MAAAKSPLHSASRSRRELSHERIVEVAARQVRRQGTAGVGVADVMQQAGLTHGGFYAHFESREALLAEAIARAGQHGSGALAARIEARQARGASALRALVEQYLSETHLSQPEAGCVVAALVSEMPRQPPAVLAASAARVRGLIALVQRSLPAGTDPANAPVIASTMVGALQMARTLDADAEARGLGAAPGKSVLAAARRALLAQYDH